MSIPLDGAVYAYCKRIEKRCYEHPFWAKKMFHKKRIKWDLPSMAVVCKYDSLQREAYAYEMFGNKCNPVLMDIIERFGKINQKPTDPELESRYPLGHCAEQHAADKMLNACGGNGDSSLLNLFQYSIAMRPRTKQRFAACKNCQKILPNVRLR